MRWISSAVLSGCMEMFWKFFRQTMPSTAVRVEFFGDEIDRITEVDVLTGEISMSSAAYCNLPGIALCGAAGEDERGHVTALKRSWKNG